MTSVILPDQKMCNKCGKVKPVTEFYQRTGLENSYLSECKLCMKWRSKNTPSIPKTVPRVESEKIAIRELAQQGIHALPGKAVSAADVDVVAFGCVWIEVKYSVLDLHRGKDIHRFVATPKQIERGYLAHIVMLICEDLDGNRTFHLFPANHPVFYKDGRLKAGMNFTPGAIVAKKHGNNRMVMTQPLMDEHRDNYQLVWSTLKQISQSLRQPIALEGGGQ